MARTRFSGPIRSSNGFEVGTGATNTAVINSSGNIVKAGAISGSTALADGIITSAKLASEAAESKAITGYAATAALPVATPVYISGYFTSLTTPGYKFSPASGVAAAYLPAEFLISSAATAAKKPVSAIRAGSVARNGTAGTLVYLSSTAAGELTESAPTAIKTLTQAVGVQTSTVAMKSILAYSKVVARYSTAS